MSPKKIILILMLDKTAAIHCTVQYSKMRFNSFYFKLINLENYLNSKNKKS